MLTTFPHCNFSSEFPKILSQNLICYHWLSMAGNSKTMHCGILINMPYRWKVKGKCFFLCFAWQDSLLWIVRSRSMSKLNLFNWSASLDLKPFLCGENSPHCVTENLTPVAKNDIKRILQIVHTYTCTYFSVSEAVMYRNARMSSFVTRNFPWVWFAGSKYLFMTPGFSMWIHTCTKTIKEIISNSAFWCFTPHWGPI